MPRSILVALDGSPFSSSATALGIQWAKQYNALLVGLGVVDEPTILAYEPTQAGAMGYQVELHQQRLAMARKRVEQLLESFTLSCTRQSVSHKLLEDSGSPAEQIMLESQRYDLILLGQQTYFRFHTEPRPDDTLQSVVKHSPRPVVAVPERLGGGSSIVIAYDGSLQAARTLQMFLSVGLHQDLPIHIVSSHADKVEAAKRADRAVEFLRFHNVIATPHAVSSPGSPADTLLKMSRELDARLLVMGAYGRATLVEFFFGSVTKSVLAASPVPLFLYH